jgi:hypothetical protein
MKKVKNYPVFYKREGKHGDDYFQCNSKEGENELFFELVKQESQDYEWMNNYVPYNPIPKPDFTKEDIQKMPLSLQPQVIKTLQNYNNQQKEILRYKKDYETIKNCTKENARSVHFNMFQDNEYSRIEEINFEIYK